MKIASWLSVVILSFSSENLFFTSSKYPPFQDGKAVKRPSEREEEDVEYEHPEPNVHCIKLPKVFEKDAGKYRYVESTCITDANLFL